MRAMPRVARRVLMARFRTTHRAGAASIDFGWGRPSRCHQGLITPAAPNQPFSDDLESWLESPGKKTLGDLTEVFEEKSFAIALLLLMITSALPIPTGGITNVFELIAMLLAFEMIFGRRTIWLPQRLLRRELGPATTTEGDSVHRAPSPLLRAVRAATARGCARSTSRPQRDRCSSSCCSRSARSWRRRSPASTRCRHSASS